MNLLVDGKTVQTVKITPDEKGNWTYSFKEMPKYADGKEIAYTITEEPVTGYTTTIDGYHVTNSFTPPTGDMANPSVWVAMMAASLLTLSAVLFVRRRRVCGE